MVEVLCIGTWNRGGGIAEPPPREKEANVEDKEGDETELGKFDGVVDFGDLDFGAGEEEAEADGSAPYDSFRGDTIVELPEGETAAKPSNVEGAIEIEILVVLECLLLFLRFAW